MVNASRYLADLLGELQDKWGLSKAKVSHYSQIPYNTVCRIYSGEAKYPTFHKVWALIALRDTLRAGRKLEPLPKELQG